MTWFKVDDSFHSHPKVLATEPAALGLWVVAGTWSMANLTDGFVPDHVLVRLLPGAAALAPKLVSAGLWRKVRGGYKFHDWKQYQPLANDVRAVRERRAQAGRLGGLASGKTRSGRANGSSETNTRSERDPSSTKNNEINNEEGPDVHRPKNRATSGNGGLDQPQPRSKTEANASALASRVLEPPTRPDPPPSQREGGSGDARHASRGAARAPQSPPRAPHPDDDIPTWRSMPPIGQLSDEQRQLNSDRAAEARAALARPASADESAGEPAWTVETTGGVAVIGVPDDYDPDARWEGRASVNILPFRPRTA